MSECFAFLLEKGTTLKGKNLLSLGANSFLLPFSEGAQCAGKQTGSYKSCLPC